MVGNSVWPGTDDLGRSQLRIRARAAWLVAVRCGGLDPKVTHSPVIALPLLDATHGTTSGQSCPDHQNAEAQQESFRHCRPRDQKLKRETR